MGYRLQTDALLRVVREYFNHPRGFFLHEYEYSVGAGYAYEGMWIYAYDREHDLFFKQDISPQDIDDNSRSRKTFGETYGKAIDALRDKIREHEEYYTRGYW